MPASFTPAQERALEITSRVASSISVIGCLFVLITFVSSPKFRRPINRIIFYAIWGNFFYNVATLISISGIRAGVNSSLCQFQGFLIQWGGLVDVLWNLSVAINVYLTVYRRYSPEQLRSLEWIYILVNYGVPFIIAITLVFVHSEEKGKVYGSANYWCWISTDWEVLRLALMYDLVWFGILGVFIMYCLAGRSIYMKRKELKNFELVSTVRSKHSITADMWADPNAPKKTTEVKVVYEDSNSRSPSNTSTKVEGMQDEIDDEDRPAHHRTSSYERYSVVVRSDDAGRHGSEAGKLSGSLSQQKTINSAAVAYTKRACLFFCALLITWITTTINRIYFFIHPNSVNFALSYAAISLLPLMGFWNTVTYIVCSLPAMRSLGHDIKAFFGGARPSSSHRDSRDHVRIESP